MFPRKVSLIFNLTVQATLVLHSKHSSWWRHFEDVFRLRLQRTSSRRLQEVLIKTNMFALALRLQKTSSRHLQDFLSLLACNFIKEKLRYSYSGCFWGLTHVFKGVRDKNQCDCLQCITDLAEKGICCRKNPEILNFTIME